MKNVISMLQLLIFETIVVLNLTSLAIAAHDRQIFSTKHGKLTFVDDRGQLNATAVDVKLNGKIILSSRNRKDKNGTSLELTLPYMIIPYQYTPKSSPAERPRKIDRIVVEEGPDGNCIRHFIILDFTMEKPFVSERFGDNPNDQYCLTLDDIHWGDKETYLYLSGPDKFVYHTGGRVIGPLDE